MLTAFGFVATLYNVSCLGCTTIGTNCGTGAGFYIPIQFRVFLEKPRWVNVYVASNEAERVANVILQGKKITSKGCSMVCYTVQHMDLYAPWPSGVVGRFGSRPSEDCFLLPTLGREGALGGAG